jgi:hypothetical protein
MRDFAVQYTPRVFFFTRLSSLHELLEIPFPNLSELDLDILTKLVSSATPSQAIHQFSIRAVQSVPLENRYAVS